MAPNAHRMLFISAAWFNILAGLPLLVAMGTVAGLMGLQLNPTAVLFIHITAGLIVLFGGVYWMIARDPVRYRPYIPLGIILKVLVIVVVYGHWLSGSIPWPLPALAFGDVIYAVLFWRYYKQTAPSTK
jgi:hypothetical protein